MRALLFLLPLFLFGLIETDKVIYVHDHGDKNLIAAMLRYRPIEGDFRIVFMGPAVEAMNEAPFTDYPDRLLRSDEELHVRQKVWVPVCSLEFEKILQKYGDIETVAIRDNPSPIGTTPYFAIAERVQRAAKKVLTPQMVGHGPIDEWCEKARTLAPEKLFEKYGLDPSVPLVVFVGSYGDGYEEKLHAFLASAKGKQIVLSPHPRNKGVLERQTGYPVIDQTIEAIVMADLVVPADPTSTVVFQARALGKKVECDTPVYEIPANGAQRLWEAF